MGQVQDANGVPLAAEFNVEALDGRITLVLESAGGKSSSSATARNADYVQGLELLLSRLGALGATLIDSYVDSKVVQERPLEERRLYLRDFAYPLVLPSIDDYDELRRALTRAQKTIRRSPSNKSRGGNERKRIRLCLAVPDFSTTPDSLDRLALFLAQPQASVPQLLAFVSQSQASTTAPGGRRSRGGQGFSTDTAAKDAVEKAAMEAATRYYSDLGWNVEDVSATRSYDLHCTREDKILRVEVKGSTLPYSTVLLTPNEVKHALDNAGIVSLFVRSDIRIERDGESRIASGGIITVLEPWKLDCERLSALGFNYELDGHEVAYRATLQ